MLPAAVQPPAGKFTPEPRLKETTMLHLNTLHAQVITAAAVSYRSTCRCVSARPSTTRCWWRSTIS